MSIFLTYFKYIPRIEECNYLITGLIEQVLLIFLTVFITTNCFYFSRNPQEFSKQIVSVGKQSHILTYIVGTYYVPTVMCFMSSYIGQGRCLQP